MCALFVPLNFPLFVFYFQVSSYRGLAWEKSEFQHLERCFESVTMNM
jgi:hypothetical protein